MFLAFPSQNERRMYGGSAFVEFQFCRMPLNAKIKAITAVNNITHWMDDSLYVHLDDIAQLIEEYSDLFAHSLRNDLTNGGFDIYGINYYSPQQIDGLIEALGKARPTDHEVLAEWLIQAKNYNGFYILGI